MIEYERGVLSRCEEDRHLYNLHFVFVIALTTQKKQLFLQGCRHFDLIGSVPPGNTCPVDADLLHMLGLHPPRGLQRVV